MNGFDLVSPATLLEALDLLDGSESSVRPMSGGTALMLMMKAGVFQPSMLVNLRGLAADFGGIDATSNGGLRIGAMATLSALEHSAACRAVAPVIVTTMKRLANVRVRNVARVGGALAHGDPHMDLPPVLAALGADAVLDSASGNRLVPVEGLYTGYYETVLKIGEVITAVNVPPQAGWSSVYLKTTTRSADDWPALGVAVSIKRAGDAIADCRFIVSAATEKLTRLVGAEAAVRGMSADDATFTRAGEAAAAEAETIADSRGSAAYKSQLLRVQLRRALQQAIGKDTTP